MSFIGNILSPPKPPPAPDYAGAAAAQGAANVETARLEGRMNRPDVVSPYDTIVPPAAAGCMGCRCYLTLRPALTAETTLAPISL